MKMLPILLLMMSLGIQASVQREFVDSGTLRLTFNGKSLKKFQFIKDNIDQAGSSIRSKCFTETVRGEFGEPVQQKNCVLLLGEGQHFEFLHLNANNRKQNAIIRLIEDRLNFALMDSLESSKSYIADFNIKTTKRVCSNVNANPSCRTILTNKRKHRTEVKIKGDLEEEATVVCASEKYHQRGVSDAVGCYLTVAVNDRGDQSITKEELSCDFKVETDIQVFLKPKGTDSQVFELDSKNEEVFIKRRLTDDFKPDSGVFFNLKLDSIRFYGRDIQPGDVQCRSRRQNFSTQLKVTCKNTTNRQIDVYRHRQSNNGSVLFIKACNHLK